VRFYPQAALGKRVPEQLNKTTRAAELMQGAFCDSLTLANGKPSSLSELHKGTEKREIVWTVQTMVTGVPVVPTRVTQVIVTGGMLYPAAVVRTANVGKA
jgi:hypothetical protein